VEITGLEPVTSGLQSIRPSIASADAKGLTKPSHDACAKASTSITQSGAGSKLGTIVVGELRRLSPEERLKLVAMLLLEGEQQFSED